jgi:hypothetical protein
LLHTVQMNNSSLRCEYIVCQTRLGRNGHLTILCNARVFADVSEQTQRYSYTPALLLFTTEESR